MCSIGVEFGHRAVAMDVINDDAKAGFRRIEVLTGPGRRRRWSDAEKARIVAETLRAGATVTEVARRWAICPQQVWGWRRQAREGQLALTTDGEMAAFVPIVTTEPSADTEQTRAVPVGQAAQRTRLAPCIEIRLAGAVMRVPVETEGTLLTEVLRAIRASAA